MLRTLLAIGLLAFLALPAGRPPAAPRVGNVRAMIEAMLSRRRLPVVAAPKTTYQLDRRTKANLEVFFSPGDVEWLGQPAPLVPDK